MAEDRQAEPAPRHLPSPNEIVRGGHTCPGRLVIVGALLGLHAAADAQTGRTLRLTVVESGSSRPIPGAIATLIDSAARRVTSRLTDRDGTAAFTGVAAGVWSVLAERVGYESARHDSVVIASGEVSLRIEMPQRRVNLQPVVVRGTAPCELRPAEGARTAQLWLEARKVLTATVLSRDRVESRQATAMRYVRILNLRMRVEAETTSTRAVGGGSPFRSRPADELSTSGYVHDVRGVTLYEAPDADALLSEAFIADHCFGVVRHESPDSALIGLSFRPLATRRVPDVRGVLWLDQSTAELRYLEYGYTNLPPDVPTTRIGGRVEFARMDDGRWIVQRWHIRNPRMGVIGEQRFGTLVVSRRTEMIGYREEGGLVTMPSRLSRGAQRVGGPSGVARVEGTVFDSTRGAPLSGARVALGGTALTDTTDRDGRFRLETPLAGDYTLEVSGARLALLGLGSLEAAVSLRAGETVSRSLTIPHGASLRAQRCPVDAGRSAPERQPMMLLVGLVTDSGAPTGLPKAQVEVSWRTAVLQERGRQTQAGMVTHTADATTDSLGSFWVCGVPHYTTVRITVTAGGRRAEMSRFFVQELPLQEVILQLPVSRP